MTDGCSYTGGEEAGRRLRRRLRLTRMVLNRASRLRKRLGARAIWASDSLGDWGRAGGAWGHSTSVGRAGVQTRTAYADRRETAAGNAELQTWPLACLRADSGVRSSAFRACRLFRRPGDCGPQDQAAPARAADHLERPAGQQGPIKRQALQAFPSGSSRGHAAS